MSKSKVKSFAVGDRVSWKSQAAGIWKQKTGTVIEVVAANNFPKKMGGTSIRAHESYVVSVIHSPTTKPELYHPLVSKLRLVKRGSTSAPKAEPGGSDSVASVEHEEAEGGLKMSVGASVKVDRNSFTDVKLVERGPNTEAMEKHASDCPQGGPPRNGEPCCDAVAEEMLARDVQDAETAIAGAN